MLTSSFLIKCLFYNITAHWLPPGPSHIPGQKNCLVLGLERSTVCCVLEAVSEKAPLESVHVLVLRNVESKKRLIWLFWNKEHWYLSHMILIIYKNLIQTILHL